MHSICTILSHIFKFQPYLTSLAIFHAFNDFFELNDPEIKKHYKWTLQRLQLGMVSTFHPCSMCEKVARVTAKTGCTSCTNWTISFEVWGFRTKTRLLQKGFQVFKHILTQDFFCIQYAPFKATSSLFITFLTSFAIFHAFHDLFWDKWPWIWKSLQMNSEKVETWHGIIISPT